MSAGTLRLWNPTVTAGTFPPTKLTAVVWKDKDLDAGTDYDRTDTGTVPATSPYKLVSELAPLQNYGVTVTVGGNARTLVRIGDETSGQVGIDYSSGCLEFHSSDAGGAASVVYRGRGSVPCARDLLNVYQAVIDAQQAILDAGRIKLMSMASVNFASAGTTVVTASATYAAEVRFIRFVTTSQSGVTTYPTVRMDINDVSGSLMASSELLGFGAAAGAFGVVLENGLIPRYAAAAAIDLVVEAASNGTLVGTVELYGLYT